MIRVDIFKDVDILAQIVGESRAQGNGRVFYESFPGTEHLDFGGHNIKRKRSVWECLIECVTRSLCKRRERQFTRDG